MLEKIFMTISAILGVVSIWLVVKQAKWKAFLEEVKNASADGKITAEEGLKIIELFFGLMKK